MEIEDVVNVVAAVFDVPARQILEGGENRGARDAAIYLSRKHIDLCYLPELEQAFHAESQRRRLKSMEFQRFGCWVRGRRKTATAQTTVDDCAVDDQRLRV